MHFNLLPIISFENIFCTVKILHTIDILNAKPKIEHAELELGFCKVGYNSGQTRLFYLRTTVFTLKTGGKASFMTDLY